MGNVIVTKCCQNCTKDKEGGDIAIDELENITNNNINNNGKVIENKNINITETNENIKINEKIKLKSKSNNKQNSQINEINNNNNNNINDIKENDVEEKKKYKQTQASTGTEIKENKKLDNNYNSNTNNLNNINNNNNLNNNNLNNNISNNNNNSNNNNTNNNNSNNNIINNNNNISNNKENKIKSKDEKTILIYGPPESGKTSFIIRYFENKFDSCYIPSFSDEITKKSCFLNYGKKFNLEIIVSNNLNKIQNADCYFIFFDISSKNSFEEAKKIIINYIINNNKKIFLIGNKKDLKNVVSEKNINDLCKKYNLEYFLISVKDNIGISAMMKKFGEIFDYEE